MRISVLVGALFLASCASLGRVLVMPTDYVVSDNVQQQRLDLSFTNSLDEPVCLTPSQWPNSGGKLHYQGDRVYVMIGIDRYQYSDFNLGYCPGGCSLRVEPGETISSFIPYKYFGIPENQFSATKQLIFESHMAFCD